MASTSSRDSRVRYIDPLKMKYIRQEKKKGNKYDIGAVRVNGAQQEVDQYNGPEFEEFFQYTPSPNYPTTLRWVEVQPSQSNLQKTL